MEKTDMRRYVVEPTGGTFAVKDGWTGRLVRNGMASRDEAIRLADAKELLPQDGRDMLDGVRGGG